MEWHQRSLTVIYFHLQFNHVYDVVLFYCWAFRVGVIRKYLSFLICGGPGEIYRTIICSVGVTLLDQSTPAPYSYLGIYMCCFGDSILNHTRCPVTKIQKFLVKTEFFPLIFSDSKIHLRVKGHASGCYLLCLQYFTSCLKYLL